MATTLEQLEDYLRELEGVVRLVDRNFDRPRLVTIQGAPGFRHEQKDDLLLSYLKCIRSLSSLNACVVLLRSGFVQEVGALCRCIDEFCEDVLFLATPLGEDGAYSQHQRQLVEEYFQEEFEDNSHPLPEAAPRHRVPRTRVQAGISRIEGQPVNPHDTRSLFHTLSRTFSGYVHGAYVHTMEMYGGPNLQNCQYHIRGMLGTPRIDEWVNTLGNYVYRSSIAWEVVARRCEDDGAIEAVRTARSQFERLTGIGVGDANELLNRIKQQ